MHTASHQLGPVQGGKASVVKILAQGRDWLDDRGRFAWIIAMILGFVFAWPVGLGLLAYMIWSKRMFGCSTRSRSPRYHAPTTGNSAFDAYREQTLKRLEDEHREFMDFLGKLREAKDKAEFDQFMEKRGATAQDRELA